MRLSRVLTATFASVAMVVGGLSISAPAFAGSASWGAKSCMLGSLYTTGTGNLTVRHEHNRSGILYQKSFANGTALKTNTYYPLINVESSASIQNGTGTLQSTVRNCES